MNESTDLEAVRTEALRELGRNVVNFAKIEAGLKELLAVSQFGGSPAQIATQLRENRHRLRKNTLGTLVGKFHQNVLGDDDLDDVGQDELEPDGSDSEMSISVKLKVAYGNLALQKRLLSSIVKERNRLLHQDLALLDTSSIEDYRKLIDHLDEQNPRLLAQLEELKWMVNGLAKGWETCMALMTSPDFPDCQSSNQTDCSHQTDVGMKLEE